MNTTNRVPLRVAWITSVAVAFFTVLCDLAFRIAEGRSRAIDWLYNTESGFVVLGIVFASILSAACLFFSKTEELKCLYPLHSESATFYCILGLICGTFLALSFASINSSISGSSLHLMDRFGISTLILLISAAVEEFFFRGYLFARFRAHYGPKLTIAVTSVFFMLCHFRLSTPIIFLIELGVLALILGFLREVSRSLVPSIAAHAVYNLIIGTSSLSPA